MKIGYIIIEQFKCIAKENNHLKGFYYTDLHKVLYYPR